MENSEILHLTLKKKWFDMIASGEKKEEYREAKDYWETRLCEFDIVSRNSFTSFKKNVGFKAFDAVLFRNGYGKNAPSILVECKGISLGHAKPEWSEDWQETVFIIKLGEILTTPQGSKQK